MHRITEANLHSTLTFARVQTIYVSFFFVSFRLLLATETNRFAETKRLDGNAQNLALLIGFESLPDCTTNYLIV